MKILRGGRPACEFTKATRERHANQRNFFLYKGPTAPRDSRYRHGLTGRISLSPVMIAGREGEPVKLKAIVTNDSNSVWLPVSAGAGAVMLGCHVHRPDGSVFRESYQWVPLTSGEGRKIVPGETVAVDVELSPLPPGPYVLEFDLVSNNVCWFAINGSQTQRVDVNVI